MSARRQQTAEAIHAAAAESALIAARYLRSLRNSEGYWQVTVEYLPVEATGFSLEPDTLPVWTRTSVVSSSLLRALSGDSSIPGVALKIGFLRRRAIEHAVDWLVEHQMAFPTPDTPRALKALGRQSSAPTPYAPVRDTAIAAFALGEGGPSAEWLAGKRFSGFATSLYSDADTTAGVALALPLPDETSTRWLLKVQSKDGGWPAFDANTEPSSPDVTGHVLEALSRSGLSNKRAVEYLFRSQEQDGSWCGAWGVNYVYGSCRALRGLRAAGVSDREAPVLRGGEWLRSVQNADGGWGESASSYSERMHVPAPSSPSQTAWAILGLLAGGDETSLSVTKGIEYLVDTQLDDGAWREEAATAALVPRGSFVVNPLYRISFPLLALSSFANTKREVAHL